MYFQTQMTMKLICPWLTLNEIVLRRLVASAELKNQELVQFLTGILIEECQMSVDDNNLFKT